MLQCCINHCQVARACLPVAALNTQLSADIVGMQNGSLLATQPLENAAVSPHKVKNVMTDKLLTISFFQD